MEQLLKDVPTSILATAGTTGAGTIFAFPATATQATWQAVYGTTPSSITTLVEASMDGVTFNTLDSSTATAGAIRSFVACPAYIRGNVSAIGSTTTGTTTIIIIAKQ
jgi:hypothetical protein